MAKETYRIMAAGEWIGEYASSQDAKEAARKYTADGDGSAIVFLNDPAGSTVIEVFVNGIEWPEKGARTHRGKGGKVT